MEKVIIFTHGNDIDGIGCELLCMMAFHEITVVHASNVSELETKFREYIGNGKLDSFERIFVTDLALYNPSLEMVINSPSLSKKVLVFDHHKSGIGIYDKPSFVTIKDEVDGRKTCGTELFYKYLCDSDLLTRTKALDQFVELTRLEDTWEWKEALDKGEKAHDLAILFNALGIENYVGSLFPKLSNDTENFEFNDEESKIIATKKAEYLRTSDSIWSEAEFFIDGLGNKYAALFSAYEYRNELIEYVRKLKIDGLKYLIMIAWDKGLFGQKSYRSIEETFDVALIAKAHGGGGHAAASSVNITEEQKEKALTLSKRESLEYLVNSSYKE